MKEPKVFQDSTGSLNNSMKCLAFAEAADEVELVVVDVDVASAIERTTGRIMRLSNYM